MRQHTKKSSHEPRAKKSSHEPRVVVASAQGEVIHIKCKQSGNVVLKLKLLNNRGITAPYLGGEYEVLLDMCDRQGNTGYDWSEKAERQIAAFERVEVLK